MTTLWGGSLGRKYEESVAALERALKDCPDDLWEKSVWEVKRDEPWVWPIEHGMGEDLSDDQRLQLHSAFWNVAYHALFFLDLYLWDGVPPYEIPPPFREDDHQGNALPVRMYTRAELLDYLDHGRKKARTTLPALTDEQAQRPTRRGEPRAELLLHNLLHVREHTAQLNLFLSLRGVARANPQTGSEGAKVLRDAVRGATDDKIAQFAASVGGYPSLMTLVFQGLAGRVEPSDDAAVGFSFEGVGDWTLRVANGKASWAAGADGVQATLRMTAPDFLRMVTGDAPVEKLQRSVGGEPAALDRLFAQMPDGHPLRRRS